MGYLAKNNYYANAGLKWLEDNNKRVAPVDESYQARQAAAKKSHDRFSRYLSESAKEICNGLGQNIFNTALAFITSK